VLEKERDMENKVDAKRRETAVSLALSTGASLLLFCSCLMSLNLLGAEAGNRKAEQRPDLFEMSVEELMGIEVSLVSRKAESVLRAPAAIHVITQDDIRTSGVTTIPDALRLVPGLQVARMESNKWAVSARGFGGRFARHMLVQVDGRTVYTPLFSGVFWETLALPLEDIERIEVIRGPGSAMWGANAMNGVVNVVTKRARQTQGTVVTAGTGTEENAFGGLRYGGQLGPDAHYRIYGTAFDRDSGLVDGEDGHDDWRMAQAGFRLDWDIDDIDMITVQGDVHGGEAGQNVAIPDMTAPPSWTREVVEDVDLSGGNVLFRWKRTFSEASDLALQVYYDRTEREEEILDAVLDTYDVDFQHRFPVADRHNLMWGAGFRYTSDDLRPSPTVSTVSNSLHEDLITAFLQDEIAVVPEQLTLTLGVKASRSDDTHTEYSPSLRLAYTPTRRQTIWAAASKGVRTPSRLERTVVLQAVLPADPPVPIVMRGDESYDSEDVIAYETGYRLQVTDSLSLDTTVFFNNYRDLQSVEPESLAILPIPFELLNRMEGESYGVELCTQWQVLSWWRLQLSYAFMRLHLHARSSSQDLFTEDNFEEDCARHQGSILSTMQLRENTELGLWLRYVGQAADVDSYVELDVHLNWRLSESVDLAVACQNTLSRSLHEYGPSMIVSTEPTETERRAYVKMTWRF
jgi:iron complex outermembrane recepter protein